MTSNQIRQVRNAYTKWICENSNFNTFITLTLKQGYLGPLGAILPIERQDCVKTAWIFRDRLTRKVLGSNRVRHGHRLPLAAFLEGDKFIRKHLHIAVERPSYVTLEEFCVDVRQVAERLKWVHKHIDIAPFTFGSPEDVVSYSLKTGTDAFIEEVFLPSCLAQIC